MGFHWNEEKNKRLLEERGLSFERIVVAIEEGHLLDILEHPNKDKYGKQLVLIVEVDEYAFCIPCIPEDTGEYFLKTLYPSRKYTRFFKLGGAR